jgi:hypothetical protein
MLFQAAFVSGIYEKLNQSFVLFCRFDGAWDLIFIVSGGQNRY